MCISVSLTLAMAMASLAEGLNVDSFDSEQSSWMDECPDKKGKSGENYSILFRKFMAV